MTKYLRSHSRVTLLASAIMLLIGGVALFFPYDDEISDTAMTLVFIGFFVFCVGGVGLLVVIVRPVVLTKNDLAVWELERLNGRRKFLGRFLLGSSPIILGLFLPVVLGENFERPTQSILKLLFVAIIFLGVAVAVGLEFWKYFERQHSETTGVQTKEENYEQRS